LRQFLPICLCELAPERSFDTGFCGEPLEIDLPILYFTGDPNSTVELAVHLRPTSGLATIRPQSPGHVLIAMVVPGTSISRNAARQPEWGCRADLNRLI
jgi:hypothetical protein